MLVERRNQDIDDEAVKDGRIEDGGRDQAGPRKADAPAEIAAAFAPAAVGKAAQSEDVSATDEWSSQSTSAASLQAASPAAPSPADADGVLPQSWPVAPGSAEPVAAPPVPVYHVHDLAYRSLLSDKAVFLDFLRSFVHADWVRDLDEDSLRRIESTFVLPGLRRRESDVVWCGRLLGDDGDVTFYVLVEMQSSVDATMAHRLLEYQTAIWRDAEPAEPAAKEAATGAERRPRTKPKAQGKTPGKGKLPAIVPIVVYNGRRRWTAARRFRRLIREEGRFEEGLLDFTYRLIDVRRLKEEELLSRGGAAATAFWLDGAKEEEELARRLLALPQVMRRMPVEQAEPLLGWVAAALRPRLPGEEGSALLRRLQEAREGKEVEGMATNFERMLDRWLEKTKRESRLEERRETARRLMAEGMDDAFIERVTGLSLDEIARLRQEEQVRQK